VAPCSTNAPHAAHPAQKLVHERSAALLHRRPRRSAVQRTDTPAPGRLTAPRVHPARGGAATAAGSALLRQYWRLTVPTHAPRAAHRSSWRSIWLCMQRADAMLSALSRNWLSTWNTTCGRPRARPRQRAARAPAARARRRASPYAGATMPRTRKRHARAAVPPRSAAASNDRGRWEGLAAPWPC